MSATTSPTLLAVSIANQNPPTDPALLSVQQQPSPSTDPQMNPQDHDRNGVAISSADLAAATAQALANDRNTEEVLQQLHHHTQQQLSVQPSPPQQQQADHQQAAQPQQQNPAVQLSQPQQSQQQIHQSGNAAGGQVCRYYCNTPKVSSTVF